MLAAAEDELGPDGKKIRPGINPEMIAELTDCNSVLSGQRKKRQVFTLYFKYLASRFALVYFGCYIFFFFFRSQISNSLK